ncbi:hypothetical protein SAMN02745132_04909 [Enterovibrio nigricans DSM 22720]|uniref:Uncharacterized protein n=1 Tax=Enterovibrio nigricans DSM 22720 TaxID=1121868 RepID=A0A1T4WF74_9GAMM|nr:hypothetical protein SAMN02745132_04909 [Enterovibrio nigricans DSM 22720]
MKTYQLAILLSLVSSSAFALKNERDFFKFHELVRKNDDGSVTLKGFVA